MDTINMNYSKGASGENGADSYLYIAYASDDQGSDFSLIPSSELKYRAEVTSRTYIANPTAQTFANAEWVKYVGDNAANGYLYIAYASDDQGTGFTLTPSESKPYIAYLVSQTEIAVPDADDFTGSTWIKYIGNDGAAGTNFMKQFSQSLTIGTGTFNSVNIGTGLNYSPAQSIVIAYNQSNYMYGRIISYSSETGIASFIIDLVGGSGTYTLWTINIAAGTPSTGTVSTTGVVADEELAIFDGISGNSIKSSGITKTTLTARASASEINSGTDETKPISSKGLEDSKYSRYDQTATFTNKSIDANDNTIRNIGSDEIKAGIITGLALKNKAAINSDYMQIIDSEDSNVIKKILVGNLPSVGERNTGENTGASGVGIFKEKNEASLVFYKIAGDSDEISTIIEDGVVKVKKTSAKIQEFVIILGPGGSNTVASRILDADTQLEESWAAYEGTEFTDIGLHETSADLVIQHDLNKMLVDFRIWEYSPTGTRSTEFYSNVSFDQDDHVRNNDDLTKISIKDICTYVRSGKHIKMYLKFI